MQSMIVLQQYLPFTVLKLDTSSSQRQFFMSCNSTYRLRYWNILSIEVDVLKSLWRLQQYLPFTVLKPNNITLRLFHSMGVATVLTVYGIETL